LLQVALIFSAKAFDPARKSWADRYRMLGSLQVAEDKARGAPQLPGSAREQAIIRRFAAAFAADDITGVIALLTDDAWLSMPPAPHEYQGPIAIGSLLGASAGWRAGRRLQLLSARANTQPAFGCYLQETPQTHAEPTGLIVLTLHGDQISAITRFLDNDVLHSFGLPAALPPPEQRAPGHDRSRNTRSSRHASYLQGLHVSRLGQY
jgi:hypothetical protein